MFKESRAPPEVVIREELTDRSISSCDFSNELRGFISKVRDGIWDTTHLVADCEGLSASAKLNRAEGGNETGVLEELNLLVGDLVVVLALQGHQRSVRKKPKLRRT